MNSTVTCVQCYLLQAINCMHAIDIPEDEQLACVYALMDEVKNFNTQDSPAKNSSLALLDIYRRIGNCDPFAKAKADSNQLALSLYPALEEEIHKAQDPLYTAFRIAVAGNVIDLGIQKSFDIHQALAQALQEGFAIDHYQAFCRRMDESDEVVILADNAGEIVFDKILVQQLRQKGKQVVYIVKSSPILNDATRKDAEDVGMDKLARIVESGSPFMGTHLDDVSPACAAIVKQAKLILSKGQANFESLEQESCLWGNIFFLLKIKCAQVGAAAGAPFGKMVLLGK